MKWPSWKSDVTLFVACLAIVGALGWMVIQYGNIERKEQAAKRKQARFDCLETGWRLVVIEHGKASDQYLCLPPVPKECI